MKKIHCVPGLVCILFLLIGIASYTYAIEVPVFSPLRYAITDVQGTAVYTDTVTMGNVVNGEFHLIVQNGSGGANKVDLAEVYINGKRLIKMNAKKELIDKKFKLLQDSGMRIQLTGPKNSFVVVSIIAKKLTQVPLVIRMAQADAQAAMTNALLKIKKKPLLSSHGYIPTGSVMSQTPKAGVYVKEKSKASITVSTGPALAYNLLPGMSDALASSSVVDYDSHDTVANDEILKISPTEQIVLTKLMIAFKPDTTVKEINDLLISIGGQITIMLEGVNLIVVRIPKPDSLLDLETVISSISANSFVVSVLKASMLGADILPPSFDAFSVLNPAPPNPPWDKIDHHLDVRAHAAWNVRGLLNNASPPHLIIADGFGDGPPNISDFGVAPTWNDFAFDRLSPHGYHVLGIIAATFGGSSTERGMATGMYPGYLPLWAVDRTMGYDDHTVMAMLIQHLRSLTSNSTNGQHAVINTSMKIDDGVCPPPKQRSCVEPYVLEWIQMVRGWSLYDSGNTNASSTNLENSFIHLTSAGNVLLVDTNAALNSPWTGARLLSGLFSPSGNPVVNLTNTLVIENREKSSIPLEALGCRAGDSKYPGNLSGVGTNVFSLTGATTGAEYYSGTSMATPQVAGLASYLWALKPTLGPQDIINILSNTADTASCGGAPLIDAYGAVLALDRSYSNANIRRKLLDVNGDGRFDENDVDRFLSEFENANGAKDYSRFDLNGDGMTGGSQKRPFNLNMNYPPTYQYVSGSIEETYVSYDESALTDLDVLCFYAYSPLYTGSSVTRKNLIAEKCGMTIPPETDSAIIDEVYVFVEAGDYMYGMRNVNEAEKRNTDDFSLVVECPGRLEGARSKVILTGTAWEHSAELYIDLSLEWSVGGLTDEMPNWGQPFGSAEVRGKATMQILPGTLDINVDGGCNVCGWDYLAHPTNFYWAQESILISIQGERNTETHEFSCFGVTNDYINFPDQMYCLADGVPAPTYLDTSWHITITEPSTVQFLFNYGAQSFDPLLWGCIIGGMEISAFSAPNDYSSKRMQ